MISGARFELSLGSDAYPAQLAESPDPPARLYVIGSPQSLVAGLAVVGSRKATPYGLSAADHFASWAASAGHTVISGGAIGCDQAAHRAALAAGGRTVAVMAGGADVAYPAGARALLQAIIDGGGAVVSEHPWGTRPARWSFRTRNRIIAGLAEVLLVLEAALPSGTFSTAEYALDAGRTLAAVPGSIFAPECQGSNRLIVTGAHPVTDVQDLTLLLGGDANLDGRPALADDRTTGDADLDTVLAAARVDPMRPEDLARHLALDLVVVMRRLGALESRGLLARYPTGRYGPC